jgi:hypothetical protein
MGIIKDNIKRILISENEINDIKTLYITQQNNITKTPIFENNDVIIRQTKLHHLLLNEQQLTDTAKPLDEKWTISDTLHTLGDVSSIAADFIVPGSGAVIDTVNGFSYFIEAQFIEDEKQKNSLNLMGAITLGFVLLPGIMQGPFVLLKNTIKAGKKIKPGPQLEALKVVDKQLPMIFGKSTKLINWILTKPLGKTKLGKFAKQLPDILNNASTESQRLVKEIIGESGKTTTKMGKKSAEVAAKKSALDAAKADLKIAKLTAQENKGLYVFLKKLPKIQRPEILLKKLGFVKGKTYKVAGVTASISKIVDGNVYYRAIDDVSGAAGQITSMRAESFIKLAVTPMQKLGANSGSFITKNLARVLLPDGSGIDETKLRLLPDANPDQTVKELASVSGSETPGSETPGSETPGSETPAASVPTSQYKPANGVYNINTYSPNGDIARLQALLSSSSYNYRDNNGEPLARDNKFGAKTMDALLKNNLQTKDITTDYINQLVKKSQQTVNDQATQQQTTNDQNGLKLAPMASKMFNKIPTPERSTELAKMTKRTPDQEKDLQKQKEKADKKLRNQLKWYPKV